MKSISVAQAQSNIQDVLDLSQKERILITRGDRPCAVLVGIESYDEEDLKLANSPDFWRMIQRRRRKGNSIPLSELEARLRVREQASRTGKQKKTGKVRKKSP